MKQELIFKSIKPETELERLICSDPEFALGALWGEPRPGHPEGKVLIHIEHVLANVERINKFPELRMQLRLLAILHDTFKNKVDNTQSKSGENHHGMKARRFAEKYNIDPVVCDILELHDEAYNAWCKGSRDNKWNKAEDRAKKLVERLGVNIKLYMIFYACDNETGDKVSENFTWFEDFLKKDWN